MNAHHPSLEDFLPLTLLGQIYSSDGSLPAAIQFPAAVMFIDVSRYTALVEQLAHRGQEGLEDLPRLLSLSYGRCSEYVSSLGGEVIYFAGDSLLAYWPADVDKLGSAVRSAVDCAEMICRSGRDVKGRGVNEISPPLHIGIGAGRLWAAALGEELGTLRAQILDRSRQEAVAPQRARDRARQQACPHRLGGAG